MLNRLHGVISQKIELFKTTAVRTNILHGLTCVYSSSSRTLIKYMKTNWGGLPVCFHGNRRERAGVFNCKTQRF
jgi:hypothetical protein